MVSTTHFCSGIIILLSILIGCNSETKSDEKIKLSGEWKIESIELQSINTNESKSLEMNDYGYGNVFFNNDSSYIFQLELMKDVIWEKEIFGNTYNKTILHKGFRDFRKGFYKAKEDSIEFYDYRNRRVLSYQFYLEQDKLKTKHIDDKKLIWLIKWIK